MGTWTIIIEGTGAHHTTGQTGDANQLAANVVDSLRAAGQQVNSAVFRFGGAHAFSDESIVDTASYRTQINAEIGTTPAAPVETAPNSPSAGAEAISIDGGLVGGTA